MIVYVMDRAGKEYALEGIEGWRLMEVIRDNDLPIKAECGGACSCSTCHVYVDDCWIGKLSPPSQEEIDQLDDAFEVQDNSRLSCQILLNEKLDGLRVTLAPGIEP
ncbi:MAG: 2Fe-2S iron-sulfur cluster binding domain-containing protein [Alphaproteobacteria bacterium]|nr:2Fe-2S iron-sulfur cluster binding domain-containing protein [Alphaproteobacteria bacterium]MCK5555253.1 2Fe-2S iron-sulfur cluster binding domain-containing protein [Alphaproteobacteria bacterium]MCK5658523.1 2Fe-2S iron-sulfur cluster binding domain-containing protein [Alphaproteobacteria bacterium]